MKIFISGVKNGLLLQKNLGQIQKLFIKCMCETIFIHLYSIKRPYRSIFDKEQHKNTFETVFGLQEAKNGLQIT